MRRSIALFLALMMLLGAPMAAAERFGGPYYDEETAPSVRVVNCDEYVTLRAEPSTSARALMRIPLGASVVYYGATDDSFACVEYNGELGFVLTEYLAESWEVYPEEDTYDTYYESEYQVLYIVNCDEYVTLRSSPSTDARALTRVPLGATVGYYGYDVGKFSEVEYGGRVGYVLSKYLSTQPAPARRPSSGGAYLGKDAGWTRLSTSRIEVCASSEQVDQYGYYSAANANDANSSTTWAEGASGIGRGEWLSFFFDEREIVGFAIRAGYQKSSDVYKKNARPKEILVSVADLDGMSVTLKDTRSEQIVLFDRPVTTDYLSIELVSAYSGTRYSDTCITDVRILLSDGSSVPSW